MKNQAKKARSYKWSENLTQFGVILFNPLQLNGKTEEIALL